MLGLDLNPSRLNRRRLRDREPEHAVPIDGFDAVGIEALAEADRSRDWPDLPFAMMMAIVGYGFGATLTPDRQTVDRTILRKVFYFAEGCAPMPPVRLDAMATRVRVGISSWADAALIEDGSFYPKKSMSAEARLRYYARFFDTVEVNSAYYAIPDVRNTQQWVHRTPPDFIFHVKAYSLLTGHHPKAESLPADVQALLPAHPARTHRGEIDRTSIPSQAVDVTLALFHASLRPLIDAGKLGYVLFQFAPWVHFGEAWLAYIASLPEKLPGLALAIEFRHRSWFPEHAAETLGALRTAGLAHVIVDGPVVGGSIPRVPAVTAPMAIMRLHGRNADGWARQLRGEGPAVREKYDYLYTEAELAELKPEIDELAVEAEQVCISFNNNNRAYPVQNALMLRRMLGERIEMPPAPARGRTGDLFG